MAADFSALTTPLQALTLGSGNAFSLVPIILIFLISIAISRKPQDIAVLQLPLGLLLAKIGFSPGLIALSVYAVFFAINIFSGIDFGGMIEATGAKAQATWQAGTGFVTKRGLANRAVRDARRAYNREAATSKIDLARQTLAGVVTTGAGLATKDRLRRQLYRQQIIEKGQTKGAELIAEGRFAKLLDQRAAAQAARTQAADLAAKYLYRKELGKEKTRSIARHIAGAANAARLIEKARIARQTTPSFDINQAAADAFERRKKLKKQLLESQLFPPT